MIGLYVVIGIQFLYIIYLSMQTRKKHYIYSDKTKEFVRKIIDERTDMNYHTLDNKLFILDMRLNSLERERDSSVRPVDNVMIDRLRYQSMFVPMGVDVMRL